MKQFDESTFQQEIATGVVLVDFYADWCGPCQVLAKLMPHLAKKYEGKAVVGKVNTETQFTLTQQYAVTGLPTVIVFKDGKEVERLRGLHQPEAYSAILDSYL